MNTAQNGISEHGILTPLTKKLWQHLKLKFLAFLSKIYDGSELNSGRNEQKCFQAGFIHLTKKLDVAKFKILYF